MAGEIILSPLEIMESKISFCHLRAPCEMILEDRTEFKKGSETKNLPKVSMIIINSTGPPLKPLYSSGIKRSNKPISRKLSQICGELTLLDSRSDFLKSIVDWKKSPKVSKLEVMEKSLGKFKNNLDTFFDIFTDV